MLFDVVVINVTGNFGKVFETQSIWSAAAFGVSSVERLTPLIGRDDNVSIFAKVIKKFQYRFLQRPNAVPKHCTSKKLRFKDIIDPFDKCYGFTN